MALMQRDTFCANEQLSRDSSSTEFECGWCSLTLSYKLLTAKCFNYPYCSWPPCVADADSIFLSHFFFFFSSPNLSGRRLDVYHSSTHDVVLVRI